MSCSRLLKRVSHLSRPMTRTYYTSRWVSAASASTTTTSSTSSSTSPPEVIFSTNLSSACSHHTHEDDHHYANNIAHAADVTQRYRNMKVLQPEPVDESGTCSTVLNFDNPTNESASHIQQNVARAATACHTTSPGLSQPTRTFMTLQQAKAQL